MNSEPKHLSLTNRTLHGHCHYPESCTVVCGDMSVCGNAQDSWQLMGNLSTRGNVGGDGKYLNYLTKVVNDFQ